MQLFEEYFLGVKAYFTGSSLRGIYALRFRNKSSIPLNSHNMI